MNRQEASTWHTHEKFKACKVRCLLDNDSVLDEISRTYPHARKEFAGIIKKMVPEKPVLRSLIPPVCVKGWKMKSALFFCWIERDGLPKGDTGYALLEVLHLRTEPGIRDARRILHNALKQSHGYEIIQGGQSL